MRILSIGQFSANGVSNTCLHRNWALHRIAEVDDIDSSQQNGQLYRGINYLFRKGLPIRYINKDFNERIVNQFCQKRYDIVWIDKGIYVLKKTLCDIKEKSPETIIIGYSPDNMAERHNQSQVFLESLPYYDLFITTKSYTLSDLYGLGARRVLFVDNAYEKSFHHPYVLSEEEKKRLGGEIGFIGTWEQERCDSILYLAQNGLPIRVWGGGKWLKYKGAFPSLTIENTGLYTEDYNKAISAFDISLCFLKKINHDLQTTRTMEIPACGSLLLAERTSEHTRLFEDGKEAVFFSSKEELLNRCKYYLNHPNERKQIAQAGLLRCRNSGYSNDDMIRRVIRLVVSDYCLAP